MTATAKTKIIIQQRVVGGEARRWWEFYDRIFGPTNEDSPCRQSFHLQEFMVALRNATMVKLAATGSDGSIQGLTMFCRLEDETPLLPWINPQYFKKRWPEYWGRIIYVPAICVPEDIRGLGVGEKLMLEILQYMRNHSIPLIGFDHSMGRVPYLTKLITKVTEGKPMGSFSAEGELDHHVYQLLGDRAQLPEE